MPTNDNNIRRTAMGACASCGEYRDIPCNATCTPGKKFKLNRSRRALRDARKSWAVREKIRIDNELIRDL